jgi:hypothetical protein
VAFAVLDGSALEAIVRRFMREWNCVGDAAVYDEALGDFRKFVEVDRRSVGDFGVF